MPANTPLSILSRAARSSRNPVHRSALRDRRRSISISPPPHRDLRAKYAPRPEYYAPSPAAQACSPSASSSGEDDAFFRITETSIPSARKAVTPPAPLPDIALNPKNRPTVRWDEVMDPTPVPKTGSRTKRAIEGAGRDLQISPPAVVGMVISQAEQAIQGEEKGDARPSARRTTAMDVAGVHVPPKPIPPGEEECCMSGCVNCIYTIYADDLLEYNASLSSALSALRSSDPVVPVEDWPEEIRAFADRRAGGKSIAVEGAGAMGAAIAGGAVAKDETKEEMRTLLEGVDPGLRAFLEMEARLKAKTAGQGAAEPTLPG